MAAFKNFLLLSLVTTAIASPQAFSQSLLPRQTLPSSLPAGWTSQGCYTDAPGSRTLKGASTVSNSMTIESCISFCAGEGFPIAGVEYSRECYCDYSIQYPGAPTALSECNMPCSGEASESCGAGNRINIFKSTAPGPSAPPVVGGWDYQGCFTDAVSSRALPRQYTITGGATIDKCIAVCNENGFSYAGLEYSDECYCGNGISTPKRSDSECTMTCKGNRSQLCGGPDRLTVYRKPGVTPPDRCSGKPLDLCCMNVAPWSTNSAVWGGICGYTPPVSSELVGARCIPRPSNGVCPTGTRGACCTGFVSGQCGLGTNCALPA